MRILRELCNSSARAHGRERNCYILVNRVRGKSVENAAVEVVYWKHWGEAMTTREEALRYGMTFPDVYQDMPFRDANWVLVRCRGNRKAFLWTYEYKGAMRINVKVDPAWRDFWRQTYEAVLPGYHQNKEHWNTVILDGTVPDDDVKRMIAESYDLVAGGKRKGTHVENDKNGK